ncbi:MAG: hypothetical protein WCS31_08490 [Verrucomicrobiae bacterium]
MLKTGFDVGGTGALMIIPLVDLGAIACAMEEETMAATAATTRVLKRFVFIFCEKNNEGCGMRQRFF